MVKLNEVTAVQVMKDTDYALLTLGDGSVARIDRQNLASQLATEMPFSGSEVSSGRMNNGWYRIATTDTTNNAVIVSGLFNIGNSYGTTTPGSVLFYLSGSGYVNRGANMIGKFGSLITKVRFVYKASNKDPLFIDVYYNNGNKGSNVMHLTVSNAQNIRLQTPELVSDTPPSDYLTDKFVL